MTYGTFGTTYTETHPNYFLYNLYTYLLAAHFFFLRKQKSGIGLQMFKGPWLMSIFTLVLC